MNENAEEPTQCLLSNQENNANNNKKIRKSDNYSQIFLIFAPVRHEFRQ